MIQYILQKIRSKKWMMLCLLTGNVLFVSILCCISMYTDAVRLRTMTRNMYSYMEENSEYPMKLTLDAILTVVSKSRHNGELFAEAAQMASDMAILSGTGYKEFVEHYNISVKAQPEIARNGQKLTLSLQLGFLGNLQDHVEIVNGSLYEDAAKDGIIPVVVSEKMLATQKLILGEVIDLTRITDKDGNPVKVRIEGVFKNSDFSDPYWVKSPSSYDAMMFMSEELFKEMFVNLEQPSYPMRGSWYILFDYQNLDTDQVKKVIRVTGEYVSFVQQQTAVTMTENYTERLKEFLQEDDKTSTTLWILQTPILILLAAFISMVSRQMLMLEETEIAVYKSRGIGKVQILLLYTGQSLILNVIACMIGIPVGAFLCQILGSSNAFLEFVGREALKIDLLNWNITADCLVAVIVSTIVMVIPVIKYADTSIVGYRQKKGRKHVIPFWQRYGLDFLIFAISCYGYYNFSGKEKELMKQVLAGENLDPLLYFSSSLFIVGAGLVMIRVIHYIVLLIFWIGRRFWNPALYASFIRVIRTGNQQNFIIVFLILTIALGIFNAQTARTVNANDENNIMYRVGADVVFAEKWKDNKSLVEADVTGTIPLKYQEPDFDQYLNIEGVESGAKVYYGSATMEGKEDTILMGIDTKEFGETAWFTDGLLDSHWYHYLNAMAESPYGILVSESFRKNEGYQLGDTLYYSVDGTQTWGIICGIVDYWPGFEPIRTETYNDRKYESENYLIIAHRAQLQSIFGVLPYKVYLKTDGSTEPIFDYLMKNGIELTEYTDATQIIVDHKNDSILQGTNGMLTVGFIVVLLICFIGFMIFWILSIGSRTLQFGVFRAMGMTMKEIMTMLINEQIFITGFSVVAGVLVGLTASKLFVPLIQIAYANVDNLLPLKLVNKASDTYRILTVVSVMIIACISILRNLVYRTKIAQALKLGED